SGAYAHANHYLDPVLAADSGDPRPNSITRLSRALELVTPGMDLAQMKALLSDKQHSPDSICRDRTVAAFVADTVVRQVQVCWGEPYGATWSAYGY
ncbi:MAG TPA: carcinine hydrolase/isopenicillin-N N-acyltransferase family protein, partial [Chloroflexota bacterium]|nr:carcinine hydrolase/isopenicillin-N N-acyltransferase family protein [Chloroflexota bacterium]